MEKKDYTIAKDADEIFDLIKSNNAFSVTTPPVIESIQIKNKIEGNVSINVNIYKSR